MSSPKANQHTHTRSNHKAMVQRISGLNALRKPSQATVEFWVDDGQEGLVVFVVLEGEGMKECRSRSVRGLVEVWLQRSEMTMRWDACNGNYWSDSRKL